MSEKNRKSSTLDSAASVLQTLMQSGKSPLAEQFIRWKLWNSWEEVVGAEMAKNSLPVGYLKGTLYIWVNSSARMQEMTFLVRPLLKKVNEFGGKNWVRNIRFTLDRKSVPQPQESEEGLREFLSTQSPNEDGEPPRGR